MESTNKNDLGAAKSDDAAAAKPTPEKTNAEVAEGLTVAPVDAEPNMASEDDPGETGDAAEDNALVQKTDRGTFRRGQGNTDPKDFEVFGEGGNYIEKRDR